MPDQRERDLAKCEDMRLYAERACDFLGDKTLDDFLGNTLTQDAIIRCVEVIGEAGRFVSDDSRSRSPEIPWRLIIGLRNILAHDYGTIDLDKVYQIVCEEIPKLLHNLRKLIKTLEEEVGWEE